MTPELRLLGPVQLWRGDRQVDLGSGKQRCVLAVLCLADGRPITVESVIDRVWDDTPPPTARSTLFSYICRLRKILASSTLQLANVDGGYRLDAVPDSVDLWRARTLVARARTADPRAASALLEQAVALYAGTALCGLRGGWIERARQWIDGEFQALLDLRYATELRLGRHAQIVGPLVEHAAAYPNDERLAGHLMRALSGCGRAGEALATYAAIRRTLAEEFGTQPGPELVDLHRQILAGDRRLAPSYAVQCRVTRNASRRYA